MIKPVTSEPALFLRETKMLVISDLHLGIESELASQGIILPSQTHEVKDRILKLIERTRAEKLLLLGDVKHNVPRTSWKEWKELPEMFEEISNIVEVEIVPGNHDSDLEGMVPRKVKIHSVHGTRIGEIGFVHGHAWPSKDVLCSKTIIMGHMHPAYEFTDRSGCRKVEPVFLCGKINSASIPGHPNPSLSTTLMVLPPFSRLVGGAAVNKSLPDDVISPLFKSGAVSLPETEVYLLDLTYLGRVKEL